MSKFWEAFYSIRKLVNDDESRTQDNSTVNWPSLLVLALINEEFNFYSKEIQVMKSKAIVFLFIVVCAACRILGKIYVTQNVLKTLSIQLCRETFLALLSYRQKAYTNLELCRRNI